MSDRIAVLQGGTIQQLDTPRKIYDKPANPFVASFIGASNLFEGAVSGQSVMTGDGDVIRCLHGLEAFRDGNAVTALIRPEQLSLSATATEGPSIEIEVEQIVFVGSSFELLGHTARGRKLSATIPAAYTARIAAAEQERRAVLTYDPAAVHLMPGNAKGEVSA